MNIKRQDSGMDVKRRISILWIVVMFNMLFADILSLMIPGALQEIMTGYAGSVKITQEIMLLFAVLLEIPIAMIIMSRVLKHGANRWANIIASLVTIAYVVGGGSAYLHYYFFATIEVACMLLIVWYSWKWKDGVNGT